jgi:hypothetical protein
LEPTNLETPPTLDDIVDGGAWGAEPSESYVDALNLLDTVARQCLAISQAYRGIPGSAGHFYASVLFTTMLTRTVSLLMLAPHSNWASKVIEHWDYSSASNIARSLLETRLMFQYLCVDSVTDAEWQCRWNLLNLHDCERRIRLFGALQSLSPDCAPEVIAFRGHRQELEARLNSNSYFQALPDKRRAELLKAKSPYLHAQECIAERAGIAVAEYRYLQVLWSAHVHSLPMAFLRMGLGGADRGTGLPSPVEEGQTSLCLKLVAKWLGEVADAYAQMFAKVDLKHSQEPVMQAEDAADVIESLNPTIAIGGERKIHSDEFLTLTYKRTGEDTGTIEYRSVKDGELVLLRDISEEGGITQLDTAFWDIDLDGTCASTVALEAAMGAPHLEKVDHNSRTVHLKTRA